MQFSLEGTPLKESLFVTKTACVRALERLPPTETSKDSFPHFALAGEAENRVVNSALSSWVVSVGCVGVPDAGGRCR